MCVDFYLETVALLANNILRWNLDVLEKDFRRVATPDAHLLLRWSASDTTETSLDDKSSYLVLRFACFAIFDGRLRENGHDVGETAVRYPDLATVENVVRSVRGLDRARTYRSGIGTGSRFRQAESGVLAVADSRQIFGLLLRSAVQKYALRERHVQ